MNWLAFAFCLGLLGVSVGYLTHRVLTSRCRQIIDRFRERFGDNIKIISGCGVVSRYNRVPGVLALVDERIFYEAAITGDSGNFRLQDIEKTVLEPAWKSHSRRVRKYRNAYALAFQLAGGDPALFVIAAKDRKAWQEALQL